MTSPFRALAAVPDYPPPPNPHKRDGNGTRGCRPPGFFRTFFSYRPGNTWTCDCGQDWIFESRHIDIYAHWYRMEARR